MSKALHSKVCDAISKRSTWEKRQTLWYDMAHSRVKRQNKPYRSAAELRFPLIDTTIEKLKPFYFQQVFSGQRLAQFVSLKQQAQEITDAAADALDWKLREESNFKTELLSNIYYMLLRGRGLLKGSWDHATNEIRFDAIDPMFLVVAPRTNRLCQAPWICEVRQLSVDQYRMDPKLNQDNDLIRRIRGGERESSGINYGETAKEVREGMTHSNDPDTIILWEFTQKTATGWDVKTFSPNEPDEPLREPYAIAVTHKGRAVLPLFEFPCEIKDKGYYASRGISERLAGHENYASKIWNAKADILDFVSKPLFTSDNPITNTGNVTFMPGEVMPPGFQSVQFFPPPIDLDNEIALTRQVAEQSVMMPDFGVGGQEANGNKTATEVDYIRTLSGAGVDLKGQMFRTGITELLRWAWACQLTYQREELAYVMGDQTKKLPAEALHDAYYIVPDGLPDQWNKGQKIQQAGMLFQNLKGHPNVDQGELVKDYIAAFDSRKVKTLYLPTQEKIGIETKDEMLEVLLLMEGAQVMPRPEQDHATRIKILFGKLQQLQVLGAPVNPVAQQRIQEHIAAHLALLAQANPAMAKQIMQGLEAAEQQSVAMQPQIAPEQPQEEMA